MGFPFPPRPMRALPPRGSGSPRVARSHPRTVSALTVIPWRSVSFSAANVGPKSPYVLLAHSFSASALTFCAGKCLRFEGLPRPRCARPADRPPASTRCKEAPDVAGRQPQEGRLP